MNQSMKLEIKRLIKELEKNSAQIPPKDAENILREIITPLLEIEGYSVTQMDFRKDSGVDFVAQKYVASEYGQETIGIEYKHFRASAVGVDTIHRIIGASLVNGFDRAMVVTNSRFTYGARRIVQKELPTSIELMDIDALRAWVSRIEETESIDLDLIILIRTEVSKKFINLIAETPRYLDEIEWRELERLLSEVFEGLGFSVQLTPASKDGGKDIIVSFRASGRDHIYYIEIKHWRSGQKVGAKDAKEFLNIIINEEIDGGLYLSTYGYCSNAIESLTEIQRQRLRFGSEGKIVALCKTYVKSRSGLWSPTDGMIELLYDGTI